MDYSSSPTLIEYLDTKVKPVESNVDSLMRNFKLKRVQQTGKNKIFEELENQPFSGFNKCDPLDDEEYVFDIFKSWLADQHELFLTTYEEPQKEPCGLPHFHTGITKEEKEAKEIRREQEKQEQQKLDNFVQDRLKLLNNLLAIYRRVRENVEDSKEGKQEYAVIASTLVKQMALEYLYIRVHKCRIELHQVDPLDPRCDELANVADYTARTAEKLRCLIEQECDESVPDKEGEFSTDIIHNMARMYLSEIEKLATGKKSIQLRPQTKADDSEEKVLGMTVAEDLQDDDGRGEAAEDLDLLLAGESGENLRGEDEASEREPLAEARDLLQADEGVPSFDAREFLAKLRQKLNPLELHPCAGEAARAQAFKRRLWAANCFHFFTHKVIPELANRYRLIHIKDHAVSPVPMKSMPYDFDDGEAMPYGEMSFFMEEACCCDEAGSLSPSMVKCECDCDTRSSKEESEIIGEAGSSKPKKNRFKEVIKHFVSYFQDLPAEWREAGEEDSLPSSEPAERYLEDPNWPLWTSIDIGSPEPLQPSSKIAEECGLNAAAEAARDLSDANIRYISDKPEVWGIVVLLLREFFIHKPPENFEMFARNVICNKNFASHLGNYLLATHEAFRRKEMMADPKCCVQENDDEEMDCRRYRFGRSDAEWWKHWGVDCRADVTDANKTSKTKDKPRSKNLKYQANVAEAAAAHESTLIADLVSLWAFPTPPDPCAK